MVALNVFPKYKRHQKRGNAPAYLDNYTQPDVVKANSLTSVSDANSSSNSDSLEEEDVGDYQYQPYFQVKSK